MPRFQRRRGGSFRKRFSKVNRVAKMITGKNPKSAALQMVEKGVSIAPVVAQLARSVDHIYKMINVEDKYMDTSITIAPDNTGIVTLLSGIAQGLTDVTRIGNKLRVKDIYARLSTTINALSGATFVRVILFSDKECASATPAVTDVLQSASHLSPINRDNSDRFVIIKDTTVSMAVGTESRLKEWKWFKTLPIHIWYDGTGATVADCRENTLFMLTISNEPTNAPSFAAQVRVKFYDN